jgi:hypothetical protein
LNVTSQHWPAKVPPPHVPKLESVLHAGCAEHVPAGQSQGKGKLSWSLLHTPCPITHAPPGQLVSV